MTSTAIAACDVRRNDRRTRLAAILQAYGDGIQKSVFILQVDGTELEEIRTRALRVIDTDTEAYSHSTNQAMARDFISR